MAIRVFAEKSEARDRDKKRNRIVLEIGNHQFHLSRDEAFKLHGQLSRYKLQGAKK